jgi:hypothetical protein
MSAAISSRSTAAVERSSRRWVGSAVFLRELRAALVDCARSFAAVHVEEAWS